MFALRRNTPVVLFTVLALLILTPSPASAVSASLTPIRTIGFSGHAGLYGWGAATMSDGSVLIGDYWNYRVQRYATDGTLIGTVVPKDGIHQAPFDVAVDLRDDSVYVADTDGGRNIDKYSASGQYLFSFGSQQVFKYPSWLDVDANGRVAVGDSTGNKVVVFNDQGQKLFEFASSGTGNGQLKDPRGVAFDAAGNLYVADSGNKRIEVFSVGSNSATYLRQWPVVGDNFRGLSVDQENGWVYLVNAAKGIVNKFDLQGNALGSFGGFGTANGKFLDGGRGITVDGDGNVWVGDMPNFRAQKFSPSGTFLLAVPSPPQPPPPGGFALPSSAALDASGNLFVVDSYNWRVQKLLVADGSFVTQWGRRGGATVTNGFQYPRGIAIDRNDGSVVVADTDNSAVKKYTNNGVWLWTATGVKSFAVDVATNGTIYAVDFQANVVKVISAAGVVTGTIGAGLLSNPRGIAVDADGTLWVANRGNGTIAHLSASGSLLGRFGSIGTASNQLAQAADVEVDGSRVFVADQSQNQIKVWAKDGTFLLAVGGGGTGLGRMFDPMGLDLSPDGTKLYVTEFVGERVQEFLVGDGQEPETNKPTGVIQVPSTGQVLPGPTVTFSGTASDDTGLGIVQVAIKNPSTGLWWTGTGWGAFTWLTGSLSSSGPGVLSASWSFTWTAPTPGSYGFQARVQDIWTNIGSMPFRSFTVT
jgi:tripartite motif-containing protein 71